MVRRPTSAEIESLVEADPIANLLVLVNGWSIERLAEPVYLSPDEPLQSARVAEDTGSGILGALQALRGQIDLAAPLLLAAERDAIEPLAVADSGPSGLFQTDAPRGRILRAMLCDLHLACARLLTLTGEFRQALSHVEHAAASAEWSGEPQWRAVEIYVAQDRRADAVAAARTLVLRTGFGIGLLWSLGALWQDDDPDASRVADLAVDDLVGSGPIKEVSRRRIAQERARTEEERSALVSAIDDAITAGSEEAVLLLLDLLAESPDSAELWGRLGAQLQHIADALPADASRRAQVEGDVLTAARMAEELTGREGGDSGLEP